MKASEIIEAIEKIAPKRLAASWDNCGIQVAALRKDVDSLALCLDPTPFSMEAAVNQGAQMVLSHHPLLMQGRLPSTVDNYHRVLSLLFKNDVSLYAAHTSLDVNPSGPVSWLAELLDLKNRQVLEVVGQDDEGQDCGFGLVGQLPQEITLNQLLQDLSEHIDLSASTLCGPETGNIRNVAYCTGSGSSLAKAAKAHDAHIFITGDVKYHSALESPLCILDVGHHSLEEEMMRRLSQELAAQLPALRVSFIASQSPLRPALA